jgi:hypothetical protein
MFKFYGAVCLLFGASLFAAADETASIDSSPRFQTPKQPHIIVTDQGRIQLTFGSETSIFHTISTDQGKTFREPTLVAKPTKLALGMRRGPRIASADNHLLISAVTGELGGGKDGDLVLWRSSDAGKTWTGPQTINDQAASAREGLHAIVANEKRADCVWLDLRNMRTELWHSTSTDQGATWSKNALVYRSPDKSICQCCHPSLCYDSEGQLIVMWRNSIENRRDMYFSNQQKDGSFSEAVKLGTGTWEINACPMDGGSCVLDAAGKLATVWRRDGELLMTNADPARELALGPGLQPVIAATSKGIYTAWISKRPGDLLLLNPTQKKPQKFADRANDPVLAGSVKPGSPLVLAWEQQTKGKSSIIIRTVVP